ncbi:hypothetical protein CPB84DRAFT_97560 [Gymnopilus junonius]|uniref:Uncharacterized protein n=1 Tax=Gymnopilus junonius TaxID=109634 RepID=A0A9P5TRI9_GYMJU|nr:hypothetical protein CPB84DRAFT_97560 [Gymnopilus junonius]
MSLSPPRTPGENRLSAAKATTPTSDDSSIIDDLSFDYIFDSQGNFIRLSKGSSSKSTHSSPPTPQDPPLQPDPRALSPQYPGSPSRVQKARLCSSAHPNKMQIPLARSIAPPRGLCPSTIPRPTSHQQHPHCQSPVSHHAGSRPRTAVTNAKPVLEPARLWIPVPTLMPCKRRRKTLANLTMSFKLPRFNQAKDLSTACYALRVGCLCPCSLSSRGLSV